MRLAVVVVFAVAGVASGATAARLPAIGDAIRPAIIPNGDGSAIMGGPDGTGMANKHGYPNLGHIRWTIWTRYHAVGWGVAWGRCFDARGCPRAYTLQSRKPFRIVASHPLHGVFTHLNAFGCEVWRGPGVGYYPSDCRTWRWR